MSGGDVICGMVVVMVVLVGVVAVSGPGRGGGPGGAGGADGVGGENASQWTGWRGGGGVWCGNVQWLCGQGAAVVVLGCGCVGVCRRGGGRVGVMVSRPIGCKDELSVSPLEDGAGFEPQSAASLGLLLAGS